MLLDKSEYGKEIIINTFELQSLLAAGHKVELVSVDVPEELFKFYTEVDKTFAGEHRCGPLVEEVIYCGEEYVQCISVEDDEHLYLTDDFIPTHNTSNIIFLKSTDDSMLETLQKMSGTTHRVYTNSKTITRDIEAVLQSVSGNEGKVQYTMSAQEVPVISFNDMAFISERNSIVFRAGDAPIWNRNEMILPMSWRLLRDDIKQPGKDYTFQTIPTLSSAKEFDVRKNLPDFGEMFNRRMDQALKVEQAKEIYNDAYGLKTTHEILSLDPDIYAAGVMQVVNDLLDNEDMLDELEDNVPAHVMAASYESAEENKEVTNEIAKAKAIKDEREKKCYAGGWLSKEMLNASIGDLIIEVFLENKAAFEQDQEFIVENNQLYSYAGKTPYIINNMTDEKRDELNEAAKDENTQVFAKEDLSNEDLNKLGWIITADFIQYLALQPNWKGIAQGRFEEGMARLCGQRFKTD